MPWKHDPIIFPGSVEDTPDGLETCRIVNYSGHTMSAGDIVCAHYKLSWATTSGSIPTTMLPVAYENTTAPGSFAEIWVGPVVSSRIEPLSSGALCIFGMVSKIRVDGTVLLGDYIGPKDIIVAGRPPLFGYGVATTHHDRSALAISCENKTSTGLGYVRGFVVSWRY